jgi:hypothetical protein
LHFYNNPVNESQLKEAATALHAFFASRADAHAEQSKTPDRAGRYNYYKVEGDFSAETSPFEAHLKGESTIGIESRPLNLCSPQRR